VPCRRLKAQVGHRTPSQCSRNPEFRLAAGVAPRAEGLQVNGCLDGFHPRWAQLTKPIAKGRVGPSLACLAMDQASSSQRESDRCFSSLETATCAGGIGLTVARAGRRSIRRTRKPAESRVSSCGGSPAPARAAEPGRPMRNSCRWIKQAGPCRHAKKTCAVFCS